MTTALDQMLDELGIHGVHEGFPTERAALARQLLHAGVSPSDVELLGLHCRRTVDSAAAAVRVLVSILLDNGKRDERLADLRKIEADRALRAAPRAPLDHPNGPTPPKDEPREVWEHDRMCRIAWCLVNGDRKPRPHVATLLGIKPGTLEAMLARGEQLSRSPLVEKPVSVAEVRKLDQAEDDRRREFRDRMRAARAGASA